MTSQDKVGQPVEQVLAEELSGQHIDEVVRFSWEFQRDQVEAVITGQIREIHHSGHPEVVLWLTGVTCPTGDKREFIIPSGTYIQILEN